MSTLSNHRVTAILTDEALLSIRLTGRGLLVKMLITLESFGIKNLENCRKTQSICKIENTCKSQYILMNNNYLFKDFRTTRRWAL